MRIEQSQLDLSAQSFVSSTQAQTRQVVPPAAPAKVQAAQVSAASSQTVDFGDEPQGRALLMRLVAEMLLGKKVHVFHIPVKGSTTAVQTSAASPPQAQVRITQVRAESQQVRFQAKGSVQTADGRQIDFEADLALSSQFVEVSTSVGPAEAKQDPLVLNFDGKGVRLLSDRIQFDLNSDGQKDSTHVVAPGSGILFADRNGDGVANNGSELFGPVTGDGFGELAKQDADVNGWIDQSDPVFGELRVWFQNSAGPGKTYSLADLGIGAISTANAGTQFDLRAAGSGVLGQIRSSGVYLKEDNQAGIISHVDLAV